MNNFVSEGEFQQIYYALRENLTKRTMYRFKIDKDKFIEDCALEINNYLMFMKSKNEYKVEVGKAKFNESAMFVMEDVSYGAKEFSPCVHRAYHQQKSYYQIVL